ncbi:sirohydrochlorin chelatase [Gloeocapsopsis dulcis]|uniref:Cobalamin biosynthesis protein CbiX n=1 Tax=Gloeocapsopsis dulcis AAB1 = 1H9 TaxID=1433147 RepID=A0A6N8FTI0_9CHRO|nr:sirohydrochlorin chelatase [Gloeocapsopsis dulcis]MUL36064.1 cobalamin biosynthesis protein CbiX [Gloeocapsopsis dulcis AAB1 = 1H9]WNN91467.1 sirohydrochlorin chelatase [Gloeocapsopsis dulcis]
MPSAYLLVSHGSRDPRPEVAMEQLVRLLSYSPEQISVSNQQRFGDRFRRLPAVSISPIKQPLVDRACLELSPLSLAQQIVEFSGRALIQGYNKVQIVPIFLLPGTHVKEDIPAQVAIAQQTLGEITLDLRPYLGTHPGLVQFLAKKATKDIETWVLLSHGSRRPGAKEPVEAIAKQLNAVDTYWAIAPSLETRLQALVKAGYQQIGIIPYFLFPGGITDAIAQSVAQLQRQLPGINLRLTEPIGASAELAGLIWDLVEK